MTFEGKWLGGPHQSLITITLLTSNDISGTYRCPGGGFGEFSGKAVRGTSARCLWSDPDIPGAQERKVDQVLEMRLDMSGNSWTAVAKVAGGDELTWKASRLKKSRPAGQRLSTGGVFKDKDIFERLTRPKSADHRDSEVRFSTCCDSRPPFHSPYSAA